MAGNEVILKLTAEQQQQIKDATGKSVGELSINFVAADANLSEQELDSVAGGTTRKAGGTPIIYLQYTFRTVSV